MGLGRGEGSGEKVYMDHSEEGVHNLLWGVVSFTCGIICGIFPLPNPTRAQQLKIRVKGASSVVQ